MDNQNARHTISVSLLLKAIIINVGATRECPFNAREQVRVHHINLHVMVTHRAVLGYTTQL